MQQPDVRTTLDDTQRRVKWHVLAYRTLTKDEALMAVRGYLAQRGGKMPTPGQEVTIITTLGFDVGD